MAPGEEIERKALQRWPAHGTTAARRWATGRHPRASPARAVNRSVRDRLVLGAWMKSPAGSRRAGMMLR
jgi:hypothetical protein